MTYQEASEYIQSIPKFIKGHEQIHTELFLEYLGNPQEEMKVIHVAGTNGKGSVCAYLSAMLLSEGKKTGLFTSPHLVKLNERIVVNGEMISDENFLKAFEEVLCASEQMKKNGLPGPTFFEFLFGMAVCVFAKEKVEYAVLETGLGGRLDATNSVKKPVCTVITSIGLDHMEILGDTVEKIAAEKAGILKTEVPLVFVESSPESDKVIEECARKKNIFCNKVGKSAFKILETSQKDIAFFCVNAYYKSVIWKLHNIGCYQPENAMLALEAMRILFAEEGHPELWRDALEDVVWPGRMEEVLPGVYIDGAHNPDAVRRFVQSIPESKDGMVILFSAVREKNYEEMIACLCENTKADCYVVTKLFNSRAAEAKKLADLFGKYTESQIIVKEDFQKAWEYVLSVKGERTVYCLGSLYLAGMIKEMRV
ncbi:MAG: folylpolyglutamate synthase/dihydrofolate synthase family protein [Schaedlerella sp.]|nr:folylpolyglutamate synthase/dihydrofolate synthase family protein [Schaedlerella sp.]